MFQNATRQGESPAGLRLPNFGRMRYAVPCYGAYASIVRTSILSGCRLAARRPQARELPKKSISKKNIL